MLVGFISLCVGVVLSLSVGVASHSEPTFSRGCWSKTGRFISSTDKRLCPDGTFVPHWPKRKYITISNGAVADEEEHNSAEQTLRSVISDINTHLGFEILKYAEAGTQAEILVIWDTPSSAINKNAGRCRRDRILLSEEEASKKYGMVSIVYMGTAASSTTDYRTLYHELGHCAFALGHDDFKQSPMYYRATSSSQVKLYRFTDADLEAIRNYYGK